MSEQDLNKTKLEVRGIELAKLFLTVRFSWLMRCHYENQTCSSYRILQAKHRVQLTIATLRKIYGTIVDNLNVTLSFGLRLTKR